MKNKENKTFLDTLLDDIQQNALSSLYALEPTRSGISQRAIYEEKNVNGDITGTDEDDTLHITGNVTANNADHQTYIDLKGGNNIVNIDGKITARNNDLIDFEGSGSSNSITVSGINAVKTNYNNLGGGISFLLYGRDVNSLHVKGDIFAHGNSAGSAPGFTVNMYNYNFDKLSNNYLLIDGNIIYQNGDGIQILSQGYENQYTIKGSVILDGCDEFLVEELSTHNELTIGDGLFITNTLAQIKLDAHRVYDSDNQETFHSTLKIANQLYVSDKGFVDIDLSDNDIVDVEIGSIFVQGQESQVSVNVGQNYVPPHTMPVATTINGDIEASDGGKIYFNNSGDIQTFEVKGKLITQSDNVANSSPNDYSDYSRISFSSSGESSTFNFLGGISNNNGYIELNTYSGKDQINITGDVSVQNILRDDKALNSFDLGDGDDNFTLVGNLFAGTNSLNSILAGEGNDIISIKGNVSIKDDGRNELSGGAGDDTFILNGHIDAGALAISGDEGNDTLVLTADNVDNFAANYQDWLSDLLSTGSLAKSGIETIRLNVNDLQISNLGWFADIINKANDNGANITVEDKDGHAISIGNISITSTDEDYTVHITGDLTANNANHEKYIELQGINNTVNIDGKILLNNGGAILLEGHGSNNSVTASGIELVSSNDSSGSVWIGLKGSDTNTLHVTGDIISYSESEEYGSSIGVCLMRDDGIAHSNNYILVDGNIYMKNNSDGQFFSYGYENQSTIKGSIILDNGGGILLENSGVYNEITIGDSLSSKNSSCSIMLNAANCEASETVYSTLKIANQINASDKGSINISANGDIVDIEIGSIVAQGKQSLVEVAAMSYNDHGNMQSTTTINGDIEASNGSQIYFSNSEGIQTFEVKGKVITHSDNVTNSSPNDYDDYSSISFSSLGESSTFNFLGGISNNNGYIELNTDTGKDQINITGDVSVQNILRQDKALNSFDLGDGDDSFTLVGNLFAGTNSLNSILAGKGNDIISIKGNVSVKDDGRNELSGGAGDDTFILNGHIDAGALAISGDESNDTLVLTANNNNNFEANYKDWLTDFSSTGSLVHSSIENIRLDVDRLQIGKLGWFTDIINKANSDGAHITVTDKVGHQVVNPTTYLAQGNDTHNPINDVLDHYAPAAANAEQPKAFADHVAAPSTDAFTAPHFDNNSFLHEMEQQAQVHAAAVA